jgi:hypothetical protein
MGKTVQDLPHPPTWINAYVINELSQYDDIGVDSTSELKPIFAVSPTNIDELYNDLFQRGPVQEPLMIIYDRLMTFRPNAFYPHKREQLVYFLYSTKLANINNAVTVISQLLDREDASAQDLNAWCSNNTDGKKYNVFFRNTKVYQAQESRDLLDLASARTMYVNKLIIEYDYHSKQNMTNTYPATIDPNNNYT